MSVSPLTSPQQNSSRNPFNAYLVDNLLEDAETSLPIPPSYNEVQQANQVPARRRVPQLPAHPGAVPESASSRLVVCIDYGTTFTGLAFAYTTSDKADLSRIEVIQDWTDEMGNLEKVPSVISYERPSQGEVQWGSNISKDAVTMANTKLHLKPRASRTEELELTLHVLRSTGYLALEHIQQIGPDPAYTYRPASQIATDYLSKIFACTRDRDYIDFENLLRTKTPVDIVITVPVGWSYGAENTIFKAFRKAGFNQQNFPTLQHTILVSEPEAASHFTTNDIQDREREFLKDKDCFVLCDAGGGTVDVISFQVKQAKPRLELEKVTMPSGGPFGSSFIDLAFKRWLRKKIGREHYSKIDPENAYEKISQHATETSAMRELMKTFNVKKAAFSSQDKSDIRLDLPGPLANLDVFDKVKEGELTLKWTEMEGLMETCVNGVVDLVVEQVDKVSSLKGRRARNVLLVGGFGASPYLREKVQESLTLRDNIKLRIPEKDKLVTAVVQGGVVYGIEKAHHSDARYVAAVMSSYGVVINGGFEWLIRKNNLIFSNQNITHKMNSSDFYHLVRHGDQPKIAFAVFKYQSSTEAGDAEDDDAPQRWQQSWNEVAKVGEIICDFSRFLPNPHLSSLQPGIARPAPSKVSIGPLRWQFKLTATRVEAQLWLRGVPQGHIQLEVEADWSSPHRSFDELGEYDVDDD